MNEETSFIVSREHDCRIAFGISAGKVSILPDYQYPPKERIKLIIGCCEEYLKVDQEIIDADNKRLRDKFEEDNK